jgi:hypothetical protein
MAKSKNAVLFRTPPFRMSYATLLKPRPYMENGKPKGAPAYNVEMLFDPADLDMFEIKENDEWTVASILHKLVAMAKAEWGDELDIKAACAHGGMKWPVTDGTAKFEEGKEKGKKWGAYEGKKIIRVKANEDYPPQLFHAVGGKIIELRRDNEADMAKAAQLFVSGYYAKANGNVVPHQVDGRKYLTFYVNAVMFYKEGERIGGQSGEDRFGGIDGGQEDYDPTTGSDAGAGGGNVDDEIPF